MNFTTESLSIASDLVQVRFSRGDATALLQRCNAWFASHTEASIRDAFKGSRMLVSQLDLFDKARDRVRAVRLNCAELRASDLRKSEAA